MSQTFKPLTPRTLKPLFVSEIQISENVDTITNSYLKLSCGSSAVDLSGWFLTSVSVIITWFQIVTILYFKLRVNRRNNSQHDEGCCVYLHAAKSLTSFTLECSNKVFTWVWHGEGKGPDLPTLTLSEDSHKEPDEFSTGHKLLHLGKLRRPTALLFKVSLLTVFS